MLINEDEEREAQSKKSFLLRGTTSSLVPTHGETIEITIGRNDLFPKLIPASSVLQLCPAALISSCVQPRRLHGDELR
jgi:hypothetical protein